MREASRGQGELWPERPTIVSQCALFHKYVNFKNSVYNIQILRVFKIYLFLNVTEKERERDLLFPDLLP